MTGNARIDNSPFRGMDRVNSGEALRLQYHQAWRKGTTFRIPVKTRIVLTLVIFGTLLGYYVKNSTFPGPIPLILTIVTSWSLWRDSLKDTPTELLIEPEHLTFLPSGSFTISFSEVRIYEESISHIDIYHEEVSGLSKFRLLRHEFLAPDWDLLGPTLQDRVRLGSPEARVHTPTNPPDRRFLRTSTPDKW